MKSRLELKWWGGLRGARPQPGTVSSSWMLPVGPWTGGLNTISWIFFAIFFSSYHLQCWSAVGNRPCGSGSGGGSSGQTGGSGSQPPSSPSPANFIWCHISSNNAAAVPAGNAAEKSGSPVTTPGFSVSWYKRKKVYLEHKELVDESEFCTGT